MLKEFYPSILFLIKFLALYLGLNFLYGFYVNGFMPFADPVTNWVTHQSAFLLKLFGFNVSAYPSSDNHFVHLANTQKSVLAVFEGCNGMNIMIIFIAFLLSFGKLKTKLFWFIPAGILVIHISNLLRITGLYFISENFPHFQYFFHKYLFTGVLFIVIFTMWFYYVRTYARDISKKELDAAS